MTFSPSSSSDPDRAQIEKFGPRNATEAWAAAVLVRVAGLDPDHAGARNGVGFNKLDGERSHDIAKQWQDWGRLSEKQWACVVRVAKKYRGQCPDIQMPIGDEPIFATAPASPAPTPAPAPSPAPALAASSPVWPAGENAPHHAPPAVSTPPPGSPASAFDLAEARATLANINARHSQIAGELTKPDDPAHGARCARQAEHERLSWCCQCCSLHPDHGAMRHAANNLCVGTVEFVRQAAVVARLEGDVEGAAWREAWCAPPTPADIAEDEAFRSSLGLVTAAPASPARARSGVAAAPGPDAGEIGPLVGDGAKSQQT